MFFLFVVSSAF